MPNNPLEKMSNIKDIGMLYLNGSEQERSALIQGIQINTQTLEDHGDRKKGDAAAEAQADEDAADAKLPHYGAFPLGASKIVRGLSIPTPKYSTADAKAGPPDRISVSMRGKRRRVARFLCRSFTEIQLEGRRELLGARAPELEEDRDAVPRCIE
jgi:hypothetical protein